MADYYSPRWWQTVPPPVRRLFDRFPLVVHPANELPARSPGSSWHATSAGGGTLVAEARLPTLHVFTTEQDAQELGGAGRPSFNPSCLKWQVRRSPS